MNKDEVLESVNRLSELNEMIGHLKAVLDKQEAKQARLTSSLAGWLTENSQKDTLLDLLNSCPVENDRKTLMRLVKKTLGEEMLSRLIVFKDSKRVEERGIYDSFD